MPQEARTDGVWAQQGVTAASEFHIPADELVGWAAEHRLDCCFFDQNYEFDAIAALSEAGTKTIGRFVWERFSDEHVGPATDGYELVYAMTRAEQRRYAEMGIEAPYLRWGIHPEYAGITPHRNERPISFHYHAGLLGKRKPFKEIVAAFSNTTNPDLRLILKAQIERRMKFLHKAVAQDGRLELVLEDLPADQHLQMCADANVCMAPARWEGLGLHLYEAIAFGQPILCNDDPPMNELVTDGHNGILVPSHHDGDANSGIPAKTVEVDALAEAIERLADPKLRSELEAGARERAQQLSWERTVASVGELLA